MAGGGADAPLQQTRTCRRNGLVHRIEQRPATSPGQSGGQFQIAARCGVDLDGFALRLLLRRAQKGQVALLRDLEIFDQSTHRPDLGTGKGAERIQCGDFEQFGEAVHAGGAVKGGRAKCRDGDPEILGDGSQILFPCVRHHQFGWGQAGQFRP